MLPPPSSPSISQGPGPSPAPELPSPGPAPATTSNSLTLDPNLLSKAKGPNQCKPGDVYKVNLTVRYNSTGGFDVVDTEPLQKADSAIGLNNTGDEEDAVEPGSDAEEALLGYKRPVKKGPALI
jgi:hypothetical protein